MKKVIIPAVLAGGIILAGNSQSFAASGQEIIQFGQKFLGTPYAYGALVGVTNSFDCSSFTKTVFANFGVNLPRVSSQQALVGQPVSKSNLQVGDLIFFDTDHNGSINHVGIYAGNGKMIDAEETYGVHVTNAFSPYWSKAYVSARRVLNANSSAPSNMTYHPQNSNTSSNSSTSSSTKGSYTVKSGDSLWKISQQYGVSVSTLKSLNHLTSDLIHIGQKLTISGNGQKGQQSSTSKQKPTATSTSSSTRSTTGVYKVKSGDSLWKIANKYKTAISTLKSINRLKSDLIYPGQSLKVNGSVKAQVNEVTSTSASSNSGTYKVKSGDSLWEIATLHDVTVNKLMKANHLSSIIIYPGQTLSIPQ
ncbi:LysM peptidoglycan-binding domain-containing protein [Terrilactibacillus sp. BCM23-1]|uniref:LysM peptidoglycan-binding domain-containing protein n=1 Tax=Terrilactibacillus tamarindi TaxID=2599694 RepID=A0A6N8CP05_9BACI|nr:LysM peptidoglycan-binding domain-containing protein [Terrilactibacillus tamarindi]MTT30877.1 LysM peptidoglycan-binding domain-containing protein [Terrilactibacillus tamarindi]